MSVDFNGDGVPDRWRPGVVNGGEANKLYPLIYSAAGDPLISEDERESPGNNPASRDTLKSLAASGSPSLPTQEGAGSGHRRGSPSNHRFGTQAATLLEWGTRRTIDNDSSKTHGRRSPIAKGSSMSALQTSCGHGLTRRRRRRRTDGPRPTATGLSVLYLPNPAGALAIAAKPPPWPARSPTALRSPECTEHSRPQSVALTLGTPGTAWKVDMTNSSCFHVPLSVNKSGNAITTPNK